MKRVAPGRPGACNTAMLWRSLLVALSLGLLAPVVTAEGAPRVGAISGNKVRLRAGPGTRHPILAELDRDALVVVLATEGQWHKVRVPGGFACFVHNSLVRRDPDGTAVVTATRVLLRPTAGKKHLPLETVLDRGDVVAVLGSLNIIAGELDR